MRKPMVTRTMKTTLVNVMCLNIETAEPFNNVVELARTFNDEKKLKKAVENVINSDTVKAVHIVDTKVLEKMYGLSEDDFIKYATELNPETRKAIEENETEE